VTTEGFDPAHVEAFRYLGHDVDVADTTVTVRCHYALDDLEFTETVTVHAPSGVDPSATTAIRAAARLLHLLAGVSYFKAAAPPLIEITDGGLTTPERQLLDAFYLDGLGEFAYRNDLDLSELRIDATDTTEHPGPRHSGEPRRPLIPFGGGIDSIVTVEGVRAADPTVDAALFVMSRAGDRFAAIEGPAATTGLPVVRAERALDPKVLRSAELGFRNGHVPVTGVLSAVALLAAATTGRDAVVMSNEWSASSGNLTHAGRVVNHQWSKSLAFEDLFRRVLATSPLSGIDYFSWLRPFSELWVARRFAALEAFHDVFRSCNRSFHLNPADRLDTWCGRCDKCCFIDLILSPYVPADTLRRIFDGAEPLADVALATTFRALAGLSEDAKPFECVGDVDECRVALLLAAGRPDRRDDVVLAELADATRAVVPGDPADHARNLLGALGPHHIPVGLRPVELLGDGSERND